jgi:outer membrane protein W
MLISLLLVTAAFGQYNGSRFSAGVNAVYTTTAKLYLSPKSSDPVLRNKFFPLAGILNPSVYVKYRLTGDLVLGLSSEYMEKTAVGWNLTVFSGNRTVTVPVTDGFKMIPIELSLYYLIPFSTEKFKFLMGGGAGYYYGKQIRKFGSAGVTSSESNFAYGIQVSVSMDYLATKNLIVHSEMKFRDPQFTVNNKYTKAEVQYNGGTVNLPQSSFYSKINIDGVTFVVGVGYNF